MSGWRPGGAWLTEEAYLAERAMWLQFDINRGLIPMIERSELQDGSDEEDTCLEE